MKGAIGLVEYKTVPKGVEAADAMLKASEVRLLFSSPICPGKYVTIVAGEVDAVRTAVGKAVQVGGIFTVDSHVLPNVHPSVIPALTATGEYGDVEALGLVETISAVAAVSAGDVAAKAASVSLLEIRIARGLGGKGFVVVTGDLGSVEASIRACERKLGEEGGIVSTAVIASPHRDLVSAML
ncbi:BMC domain-containing protein [Thermanaerovibrio acidaminovorans]|uniref:Microcompartments protein n=1 Tax=Thermanaerovibrio acidaminovorans (strain ATCC 49978 / DSM 6589 / Su883) TaxID=525903 RepID=D1B7S2_THEAS|nr:BMC domain-containing protein [Thermanaerovibrio acidaminovorans]ACZ18325.1 microcompartments protein [Thermanaerovibrio acidaminovorans DSM 6589]